MLPILQIGPLSLRLPGLALLAGLWLGLEMSAREGMRRDLEADRIYNFGFATLAAGVLAARLGFVLLHLNLYTRITPWTRSLGAIFSITAGTESVWTGLIVAATVATLLIRRWQLPPLALAGALAPGLAVFTIGAGLANLLSGRVYGTPTNLPWAIELRGAARHPTQIYLMLVGLAALSVVRRVQARSLAQPSRGGKRSGKTKRHKREVAASVPSHPPGLLMQVVAIILGLGLLLIEPLRVDSPTLGPGIRTWMIAALVMLVTALAGFAVRAPASAED